MLTREEIEHIQNDFTIPVDGPFPGTYWIISLDRESQMPTNDELRQLQSYGGYLVKTTYNEIYVRKIMEQKLPWCSAHNTIVFRKGSPVKNGVEQHWFYRRMTKRVGPTFVPDLADPNYKGFSLVGLLDQHINNILFEGWGSWKEAHASIFPII